MRSSTDARLRQISWGASIQVFLRDFDLIDIGPGASVSGFLYTRKIEASSMTVLPISVGSGSEIGTRAVIYGGTTIGDRR